MGDTDGPMVALVFVVVAVLLVIGVVYDVIARRGGSYRTPSDWMAISRRRRAHFRRGRTGEAQSKSER